MLYFFSTCCLFIQHAFFFLYQFQHAGFSMTIFQHAFSFIEHAFFSCSNFNMLDSSPPFFNMPFFIPWTCLLFLQQFEHAGFSISIIQHAFLFYHMQLNMLDADSRFSTWLFSFHMLLWISTCIADNVNMLCSHTYFWNQSFWISTCMSMLACWNPHGEGVLIRRRFCTKRMLENEDLRVNV